MYKTDVVRRVAKDTRLSQRIVSDVLNATLKEVIQALVKVDKVVFPGFGVFYTRYRPESEGRSFKTGRTIKVRAMRLAAFRAGELLKRAVRKNS
jgi:DNA-binding protein HU-beta